MGDEIDARASAGGGRKRRGRRGGGGLGAARARGFIAAGNGELPGGGNLFPAGGVSECEEQRRGGGEDGNGNGNECWWVGPLGRRKWSRGKRPF